MSAPTALSLNYKHNTQLLAHMVSTWVYGIERQIIRPQSLGSTPAALLLAAAHQLSYNEEQDVLATYSTTTPHEQAYTWWTFVREQGLAHRESRKPHGYQAHPDGILLNLPWPLWILFEIDSVFDESGPLYNSEQAITEVMFEPRLTYGRLVAVLHHLQTFYPVPEADYDLLTTRLWNACQ